MDNPDTYAKYLAKQEEHRELFERLMQSLEVLCQDLRSVGGDYLHEWGARNALWQNPRVQALLRKMGCFRVYFDGCALGLRGKSGHYIRKPWVFYTTIPEVQQVFECLRCTCPPKTHIRCKVRMRLTPHTTLGR